MAEAALDPGDPGDAALFVIIGNFFGNFEILKLKIMHHKNEWGRFREQMPAKC